LPTANRGYIIPAFGEVYVKCAEQLADTIRQWHPDANITIITTEMLPHGDLGGYANDWQCYELSPYDKTIKLEADMWCASPIEHYWDLFDGKELVVSRGCRDFYDRPATSRYYRKIFDTNNLPDVYNAITYWQKGAVAQEFFVLVKDMFEQWDDYKALLKLPDAVPTTDVVYAMAAVVMGVENVTIPNAPTIVHMKKHITPIVSECWTDELILERTNPGIRINTVAQWGLVHYYVKEAVDE
jgi:hypothetical protein